MSIIQKKKKNTLGVSILLAGAAGIEPASTVLETDVLPLDQAPKLLYYIIIRIL